MSGSNLIAIVTAMPEELEPFLERASSLRRRRGGLFEARIGLADVVLASTGDGGKRAHREADRLCGALLPAALLGLGVAGALSRDLAFGDLLAARSVRDAAGDGPSPDEKLLARALSAGARGGAFVTVERPVVTWEEKHTLASTVDGASPAVADMESASWARAAAAHGVPYVIVRAISDSSDEELPSYLADSVGEDGGIRRSTVVGYALARPSTIAALLRMRGRVRSCGRKLALFVERFLAEAL